MLREVISLQVGHYANFVGTHWWNLQQSSLASVDEDAVGAGVLFRQRGVGAGPTLVPRLVCVDLRGSLGHLPRTTRGGQLASSSDELKAASRQQLWPQPLEVHKQEPPPKNAFLRDLDRQRGMDDADEKEECADFSSRIALDSSKRDSAELEDGVVVWSDFLRERLDPRSVHLVSEFQHNSTSEPLNVFGYGEQQYTREDFSDPVEDAVRLYAEECDYLAGFHLVTDGDNGFGGLTKKLLDHLCEEFPGRTVFSVPVYSCRRSLGVPQAVYAAVNTALTLDAACCRSTVCAPLSLAGGWTSPLSASLPRTLSYLRYNPDLDYHTAAVLAASLDCVTLPWRLETGAHPMAHVAAELTGRGPVVCTSVALPLGVSTGDRLESWLGGDSLQLQSLMPGLPTGDHATPDGLTVFRGGFDPKRKLSQEAYCKILANYQPYSDRIRSVGVKEPLRTLCPFPALFVPSVSTRGFIMSTKVRSDGVSSTGMAAMMSSGPAIGKSLSQLHSTVSRLAMSKIHRFISSGLEEDDYKEVLERLFNSAGNYR